MGRADTHAVPQRHATSREPNRAPAPALTTRPTGVRAPFVAPAAACDCVRVMTRDEAAAAARRRSAKASPPPLRSPRKSPVTPPPWRDEVHVSSLFYCVLSSFCAAYGDGREARCHLLVGCAVLWSFGARTYPVPSHAPPRRQAACLASAPETSSGFPMAKAARCVRDKNGVISVVIPRRPVGMGNFATAPAKGIFVVLTKFFMGEAADFARSR